MSKIDFIRGQRDAAIAKCEALEAERDELLEALKECVKWIETSEEGDNATRMAFAAIARAKGKA